MSIIHLSDYFFTLGTLRKDARRKILSNNWKTNSLQRNSRLLQEYDENEFIEGAVAADDDFAMDQDGEFKEVKEKFET